MTHSSNSSELPDPPVCYNLFRVIGRLVTEPVWEAVRQHVLITGHVVLRVTYHFRTGAPKTLDGMVCTGCDSGWYNGGSKIDERFLGHALVGSTHFSATFEENFPEYTFFDKVET